MGSASVNVQGKTYHTRPVTVQVSGKANPNAAASSSASQASANIQPAGSHIGANDIYFTAEVSKQKNLRARANHAHLPLPHSRGGSSRQHYAYWKARDERILDPRSRTSPQSKSRSGSHRWQAIPRG